MAARRTLSRPLVDDLHAYMREKAAGLSRGHDLVKAINYMLKRWPAFTLFLEDGRVCLSNNAAERGLRGIAMRESLCIPSSSICKHWKGVFIDDATRATFTGNRRFNRLQRQVFGADLSHYGDLNPLRGRGSGFAAFPRSNGN